MGKNRDKLGIVASILEVTSLSATKTRIMFGANLSFKMLEKYLECVESVGLVRLESGRYELTTKGKGFLKQYKAYQNHCLEIQKLLEDLNDERERLSYLFESRKLIVPLHERLE